MITSRNNPRIKYLCSLAKSKTRESEGVALAEGVHLLLDAARAGIGIRTVIMSESMSRHPEAARVHECALATGAEILEISDSCYDKISQLKSPEGVAAVVEISRRDLREAFTPDARLLVAAGVQDPGNAGALARVAEAAGVSGCIFLGGVDIHGAKFMRASMGSCFRLPCFAAGNSEFVELAQVFEMRLLAAHAGENSMAYDQVEYFPPVAICVGGEGQGIAPEILQISREIIRIPMSGETESLNVAVAAGIILYQARKAWSS
jgi:TrmH family RNA methyltransferase